MNNSCFLLKKKSEFRGINCGDLGAIANYVDKYTGADPKKKSEVGDLTVGKYGIDKGLSIAKKEKK